MMVCFTEDESHVMINILQYQIDNSDCDEQVKEEYRVMIVKIKREFPRNEEEWNL